MKPARIKLLHAVMMVLPPIHGTGQNLLPNGNFEQYTTCPYNVSQIDHASGWYRPTAGTSDYLNSCLGIPFSVNVPDNEFGMEPARSGNGYGGFYCFAETGAFLVPGDDDREYVTHVLAAPLVPGEQYQAEFHVSLSDVSKYAVDDIGMLFTTQTPYRPDELPIEGVPQITHAAGTWLDEKNGWMRIGGCFTADSAYNYVTIGNFKDGATTNWTVVPTTFPLTNYSYYYLDDVSVVHMERPELGPDLTICAPTALTVQNYEVGMDYSWSTGEDESTITVADPGTYWVHATSTGGCTLSDSVAVLLAPEVDMELPGVVVADLCVEDVLILDPGTLPTGSDVLWSTGSTTQVLEVNTAGTYSIEVSAPGWCPTEAEVIVVDTCEQAAHIPNAFTPDGDGINDTWAPVQRSNAGEPVSFEIYDRWGGLLYCGGRGTPWTGMTEEREVPSGVYIWRVIFPPVQIGADHIRMGHVTLIR